MPVSEIMTSREDLTSHGNDVETSGTALLMEEDRAQTEFTSREEWKLACRVAASKGMSKSDLLPRFLLHICELSLCERADEITEQRIGTLIFNRPADYNPGEDNIVRSYARTMRKRLDEYFAKEGQSEPLKIVIPRGGYVPFFEPSTPVEPSINTDTTEEINNEEIARKKRETQGPEGLVETSASEAAPLPGPGHVVRSVPLPLISVSAPGIRPRLKSALWLLAAMMLGAALASVAWHQRKVESASRTEAAHSIWSQIFGPNHDTLIVPADSGLGILENLSKRSVTLEEYANGSYLQAIERTAGLDNGNFNDLGRQRYTSVADLDITARIMRLPEYQDSRAQIRYARNVTAEDIKSSSAILIGSKHTNPWVALYEPSMTFTLEYTATVDRSFVIDHEARGSSPKTYSNGSINSESPTYGVIAYLPSLDGQGHVLIVEGLNMAATQAAADLLFSEKAIGPVLREATQRNGTLLPFELLVQTSSVGAISPKAQILLTRIHK